MSRIDEALKRVAGAGGAEAAVRRFEPVDDRPVLDSFEPEIVAAGATFETREPFSADLPVTSVIAPRAGKGHQLGPFHPGVEGKLVVSDATSEVSVEQYRRLAGTLHEMQVERDLKTLMVTSALPGEGKTLTVGNLALTLSEAYRRRVLLIDADLRRPAVHTLFRLPNNAGLAEVLRSERDGVPLLELSTHLSVLPAGRLDATPTAALTSNRMQQLLEQMAARFDWVLIDAPPVGFMPDASLLAALTGAVLFVIGAGSTPYQLVARSIGEVGSDCIVGTVLNRVKSHNIPATTYYHSYYGKDAD